MGRLVKIERARGDGWEYLCTVDLEDDSTWPEALPTDIRKILARGHDDPIHVTNNHVQGSDNWNYNLTELSK